MNKHDDDHDGSSTSIIRNRERASAWFAAASATYLNIDLSEAQRICLFRECLEVANKHSDLQLSLFIIQLSRMNEKKIQYMMLSNACLLKKEYDNAILCIEKLLAVAQESDHKVAEMNAYLMLGKVLLQKDEYDDAMKYSSKSLAIAQESGEKEGKMDAFIQLSKIHLMQKESNEAISYARQGLAIAHESGDKLAEVTAYTMLVDAHLLKEEYDDAISYSKKCLTIAHESGDKLAEVTAYTTLVDAHLLKEEYDDAISYSKKCLTIAQECGFILAMPGPYAALGNAHFKKKEYDDAISYSKKCLAIAQNCGDKENEMNANMTLGVAHLQKQEYDDAISYSEKCLPIAQESGNKEAEMTAYMTLGNAHFKKKEYDDAISYSKKCLTIAQESGDKENGMNANLTLGAALIQKEKFDDAVLYSEKCLAIAQECGDKKAQMKAYMTLGDALIQKEEYEEAHSRFTEGLNIAKELKHDFGERFCRYSLDVIKGVLGTATEEYPDLSKIYLKKKWLQVIMSYTVSLQLGERDESKQSNKSLLGLIMKSLAEKHGIDNMEYVPSPWQYNHEISGVCILLRRYDEAVQYLQKALAVATTNSEKALSHFSLGEVYYELKQFGDAEKSFKESLKSLELILDGIKENENFKISFVDRYKKAYKMLLKVLVETDKKEEALVVSEHYRARSLRDILVSKYGIKKEQIAMHSLQQVF